MDHTQHALVSLVDDRRGDRTLTSLLSAAASRITAEARDQAMALREEARRLRRQAWNELQSARAEFEASRHRTMVIRGLELDGELKAAAIRAAAQDLARARQSLRRAADGVEKAVRAARLAESQAERVVGRATARPEVVALKALRDSLDPGSMCEGAFDRALASAGNPATWGAQDTAPYPARSRFTVPDPVCTDGRLAA
jgi:hypothetical protein